jgi:hypothetical protein
LTSRKRIDKKGQQFERRWKILLREGDFSLRIGRPESSLLSATTDLIGIKKLGKEKHYA